MTIDKYEHKEVYLSTNLTLYSARWIKEKRTTSGVTDEGFKKTYEQCFKIIPDSRYIETFLSKIPPWAKVTIITISTYNMLIIPCFIITYISYKKLGHKIKEQYKKFTKKALSISGQA
ncbi:hypothetical protein RF11_15774 [Thelohanellus kitauei]|uniref:Uncharacterized protein n=1 Tax=Thelohanellus kitauei TaxID=669202 RepID=A0A0C2N622_THEKT|nr:hypothetical protein RF11_15774 [Thelohanellus kitauei]